MVKILENLPLGDLGNVVHCLACIVPNSCILIGEASQNGGDDDLKIAWKLLVGGQPWVRTKGRMKRREGEEAHRAEGYGGSGQADESSIPSVGLMDSIGILVAQLVKNGGNLVIVLCSSKLAYDPLEPGTMSVVARLRSDGRGGGGDTDSSAPTLRLS